MSLKRLHRLIVSSEPPSCSYICPCCRHARVRPVHRYSKFSSSAQDQSGHSRWSKIKHDKGTNDAAKNKQRSTFAQEITTASRLFGPDPNANPRLSSLISAAKKSGFAKASIEAAIARGQGRSASGAALEPVTIEGIIQPSGVACIVECETDSRLRTLADVRMIMRSHGGQATPSSYLFAKKGRIRFAKKDGVGVDEALEVALEAGALDLEEDEEGGVVVYTEPGSTKVVGEKLASELGLEINSSEIIWDANEETLVDLKGEEEAENLANFVDALQEKESSLQGVYMNIKQGQTQAGSWAELVNRLAA
ncbi:hypothetical protein LTR66_007331 [Elasticomyces elasticus]|nr:hypothetical protein LTR28_002006 [Elasticomyces elasticus]KAK4988394.1 hypothetical protein LTR66_007331 [Elasticomyces elasticus]KAK4988777.1 hypothetical protein LTR50_003741 [Elasticomyces elasticus]